MGKGLVAVVHLLWVALTLVSMSAHAQLSVDAYVTGHACGSNKGMVTAVGKGGTAPYEYSLNGGPYQNTNVFSGLAPNTYTVTIREKNTPANTAISNTVTIDNTCLSVSATITSAKCGQANGSIVIQGAGAIDYLYSFNNSAFVAGYIYDNRPAGTYLIGVQDKNDPTKAVYSSVNIGGSAPGPTITSVDVIDATCGGSGGKITINTTGGTPPLTYSIGGAYQSGNVFGPGPPGAPTGPFTAYVTDGNQCPATSPGHEVRRLCMQIDGYYTDPGCNNNDGTINVLVTGGSGSYEYFLDGVTNHSSPSWIGKPAGTYLAAVVDNLTGDFKSVQVKLTISCLQATVAHTDATCGKDNGTITVTAGGVSNIVYSLNDIDYQNDPVFKDLKPGNYDVYARNSPTSFVKLNVTIAAVAQPTINITPTAATCADNDGKLQVSGSGGPQPYVFKLDKGDFDAVTTFDRLPSGSHDISLKDASGCVVTESVTIPLTNNLTASGGPNVPVCEGTAAVIQATSNGKSFSWTPAAGLDDPHTLNPRVTATRDITYNLTVTYGPCQTTVLTNVIFQLAPVATATPVDDICVGRSTQLHGSGGGSYSWSPVSYLSNPHIAAPIVTGLPRTTTYKLTVTDANGCNSLDPAQVTVHVTPPPPILVGNDTSVLEGQPLPLHAVDAGNNDLSGWRWTPGQGLDNPFTQDPVAHPPASVTYTVTAVTPIGCQGTASIKVKVFTTSAEIFVPNAFTPNGDGHNDLLRAMPVGIKEFKYFAVFDRYGQRVFYTTNPANPWTGNIDGRPEPTGAYVWAAAGVDVNGVFVQRKGTVMLIR